MQLICVTVTLLTNKRGCLINYYVAQRKGVYE